MTTDIYSPSNPSDSCALDDNDIEQQIFWCHSKPSFTQDIVSHFNPLNPEQSYSSCHSKPSYAPDIASHFNPLNPEQSFPNRPPVSFTPWVHKPCFARTYPGDHTKFVPYDPQNFDPQSFFFGGSSPSLGEPSKFDPCDPKIHPQDPKLLDDGFDDQFPAKFDLSYPVIGVRDDQAPDLKGWVKGNSEVNKPTDTYDYIISDASGNSKGKSTTVESIGTAANKWNKKESASVNKAALNTTGEEETGGRDDGEEFSSRETGHFARKCSLGADGGKSGGHGGGNIGRAL